MVNLSSKSKTYQLVTTGTVFIHSQNAVAFGNATFGSDNYVPIFMDEVKCTGSETHIAQCQLPQGWALHDCDHNEDAGVRCQFSKHVKHLLK